MLFIETKTAKLNADTPTRLFLLEKLQEKGRVPLIRASRVRGFEVALQGADRIHELEQSIGLWTDIESVIPYIAGDVFCCDDFALFLIFDDEEDEVRAGVVYQAKTAEPQKKLGEFCREVGEILQAAQSLGEVNEGGCSSEILEWQPHEPQHTPAGFDRFAAKARRVASWNETMTERQDALELLGDAAVRNLLSQLGSVHPEETVARLLASEQSPDVDSSLPDKMVDAGLLRREILVSCSRRGRVLFRVPSETAVDLIKASLAECELCGVPLKDEKFEVSLASTELASDLLEGEAWIAYPLRASLMKFGVPDSQIAVGPSASGGETLVMANICGESSLFVWCFEDLTAADARHALRKRIETGARHLFVVATGKVTEEGRVCLSDHVSRLSVHGEEIEVNLIEGVDALEPELAHFIRRKSQRALTKEMRPLSTSCGLDLGYLLMVCYMIKDRPVALKDIAASAAGALSGELLRS
jgi:hypothetical protein